VRGHQLLKTHLRTLTKWDFRFSQRSSHVCVFWDVTLCILADFNDVSEMLVCALSG